MSCLLVRSPNASPVPDLTGNRTGSTRGYFTNDSSCGSGDGTSYDAADWNMILYSLNQLIDLAGIDCDTVEEGDAVADAVATIGSLSLIRRGVELQATSCGITPPATGEPGDIFIEAGGAGVFRGLFVFHSGRYQDVTAEAGLGLTVRCPNGITWVYDGISFEMASGQGGETPYSNGQDPANWFTSNVGLTGTLPNGPTDNGYWQIYEFSTGVDSNAQITGATIRGQGGFAQAGSAYDFNVTVAGGQPGGFRAFWVNDPNPA